MLSLVAAPSTLDAQEPSDAPRDTASTPGPLAPIHLYLNGPNDLSTFWKSLTKPDFVILRGEEYGKLIASTKSGNGMNPPPPWAFTVDSVNVSGTVENDLASLIVEEGISLAVDGPSWVTIRLDGLPLISASENGRDLPVRVEPAGTGWQVELSGRGRHPVRVSLLVPIRSTSDGKRFDFSVPEAATTRLDLSVARKTSEASSGIGEPIESSFDKAGGRSRLRADLPPRGRLTVSWKVAEEAGSPLPALLVAQGEIALDVDPGSLRTRSTWSIRSLRGSTTKLEWRLDPADEILELELDGQVPSTEVEKTAAFTRVTIPLVEPIVLNQERRLIMSTRRTLPTGTASRLTFRGFALANAREQTGAIGVATSGNLWVSGSPGRGIRRIDPRNELPIDLRARPATALAYRFSEQPFELSLRIETSQPLVLAEGRTTVILGGKSAHVETHLDFQTPRGRLYDLTIGLPPGLEIESVGPEAVVDSWQTGQSPSSFVPGALPAGLRLLTLRLGPKVQDGGKYSVRLVGRQIIDPEKKDITVALFHPIGTSQGGGRVAILSDPGCTAELSERSSTASSFHPALLAPPLDWPWPAGQTPSSSPLLWLRHDESAAELPLRLIQHSPSLSTATVLRVHLDGHEANVRQEIECAIHSGTADHLDVNIPESLEGRWEIEGPGISQRVDLGKGLQGERLVRLKLATELSRSVRLKFRYKLPIGDAKPVELSIPWLRVAGATDASPPRVSIVAAEGIRVSSPGKGWEPSPGVDAPEEGAVAFQLVTSGGSSEAGPGSIALSVSALDLIPLPRLVASRLLLRTSLGVANESRTSARYWVESHDGSLAVTLPAGAELLRAGVGGETVRQIERIPGEVGVRIPFPENVETPLLVELDYMIPGEKSEMAWNPPLLTQGGVVQQCFWEINIPWSRAVVGVPSGWTDENDWYWARYLWKRRPSTDTEALSSWLIGPDQAENYPDERTKLTPGGDSQVYLFGRSGDPRAMGLIVASRAGLMAICSGIVLAVGTLLILVWSPPVRLVTMGIFSIILMAAAILHPTVAFLGIQCGMIGLLLTILLALMERLIQRPRLGPGSGFGESAGRGSAIGVGSTLSHTTPASDDSTAIRARPVTRTLQNSGESPTATPNHSPVNSTLSMAPEGASSRSALKGNGS